MGCSICRGQGGLHHRSLLYFFGPFVPVRIFVPGSQADEARQTIAELRLGQSE
jgi:hypothetical protein